MEKIAIGHWPIALRFAAPNWMGWSAERCSEELRHWTEIIEQPDYAVRIWRDIPPDFGDRLLGQSLQERELEAEVELSGCRSRHTRQRMSMRQNCRPRWNPQRAGG
jgi:hypothetical protein